MARWEVFLPCAGAGYGLWLWLAQALRRSQQVVPALCPPRVQEGDRDLVSLCKSLHWTGGGNGLQDFFLALSVSLPTLDRYAETFPAVVVGHECDDGLATARVTNRLMSKGFVPKTGNPLCQTPDTASESDFLASAPTGSVPEYVPHDPLGQKNLSRINQTILGGFSWRGVLWQLRGGWRCDGGRT